MHSGPRKDELITKVNVTPVIDVALVLVIILLVTAPMMSAADRPVDLPEARTREAEDQRNVSVTISHDGIMAVDKTEVAPAALRATLAARLAEPANQGVLVVLRDDTAVPFEVVRQTLQDVRAAGAQRIAIATRQRAEARP
jgi:biopolymer transport protein TolR